MGKKEKFVVNWTSTAKNDLRRIIRYIAIDSIESSLKILDKIESKAATLNSFPERGRIVPELKVNNVESYHEIIINPWRIIYKIEKKNVYIISVIDGRRNIEDILLERFLDP
jgi:addiction module RelE/StbE family toxin